MILPTKKEHIIFQKAWNIESSTIKTLIFRILINLVKSVDVISLVSKPFKDGKRG